MKTVLIAFCILFASTAFASDKASCDKILTVAQPIVSARDSGTSYAAMIESIRKTGRDTGDSAAASVYEDMANIVYLKYPRSSAREIARDAFKC